MTIAGTSLESESGVRMKGDEQDDAQEEEEIDRRGCRGRTS